MHQLATEVWINQKRQTRIDWCHATCIEYFSVNGGLGKILAKDARRNAYNDSRTALNSHVMIPSHPVSVIPPYPAPGFLESPIEPIITLRLLDVGSCFNGFQLYEEFLAVGIDLSPAVEVREVLTCSLLCLF